MEDVLPPAVLLKDGWGRAPAVSLENIGYLIMIFAVVTCSLWGVVFFALQKSLQNRLNGFGSGMGAIEMM